MNYKEKPYYSITEVAKILGISSVAVRKKVATGKLKAQKVGRNYIVLKADLDSLTGNFVSEKQKKEIKDIVKKAVKEYKITFRRLGKEE